MLGYMVVANDGNNKGRDAPWILTHFLKDAAAPRLISRREEIPLPVLSMPVRS
ncbi:MAG TPA: hypothetical protein VHS33_07485 [Sphingomicrobium sp.]|jgi:hypothetical protein|nr:hypothetical protein [Sphingomicrobium sp.]